MKKILFILLFIITDQICLAQWQWAQHLYSNGHDALGNALKDDIGNIYFAGGYTGWPFYALTDTFGYGGGGDAVIAKYDNLGNELWVKQFGGNTVGCVDVAEIAIDTNNSWLYARFAFCGSCIFGVDTFQAFNRDFALVKMDLNGNVLWAKHAGGLGEDGGAGITVGDNGNIYLCGVNTQVATFDTIQQPPGGFFAKYDSNGNRLLLKRICELNDIGSGSQYVTGKLIFSNNFIYINGSTADDSLTLDTLNIINTNQKGGLLSKFDLNGNIQSVKQFATPGSVTYSMDIDGNNNFYAVGRFFLDSAVFENTVLTNNGQQDGFIVKFDANGSMKWVIQLQAAGGGDVIDVKSLPDGGGVYAVGWFTGSAKFGTNTINAQGGTDMFLARYDSSGNCLGVTTLPNADGISVINDVNGNIVVTGRFLSNLQIGSNNFTNMGNYDIFIAKHDAITGFEEGQGRFANKELIIYANPNQGKCNITVPDDFKNEKNLLLSIYDNTGKLIQQKTLEMNEGKIKVNLEQEAKGVYNVTLGNKKKSYSGKIVFE